MKRIMFVLLVFAAFSALSFGKVIARGDSNTSFGTYTIELSDQPVMLAGEEMKCYLISYEKSPLQVKVLVDKEKRCKNYVVISDELSVMYTCDGKFFGVNKVDGKYKESGLSTCDEKLDRSDYFHQKVIAQGQTQDFDATVLIASYFPELIKE
ncbi:MAG: hypothetical protein MUE37_02650 [Bacteroidales bacterium]|nr:hypothetical protein [Bacteroidales bacterium]